MADLGKLSDLLDANKAAELAQKNRKGSTTALPASTGAPLQLPLEAIEEDPDQPRQIFDDAFIDELADDLRSGIQIKSPISVRPKGENGKYRINHGANRYRASVRANKATIPAFIDDDHNPYDQVMENLKRRELALYDLGQWIDHRIRHHGEKKGDIARRLGKPQAYVTLHLSIIDLPEAIKALYDNGITDSARTLYTLKQAATTAPDQTQSFCEQLLVDKGTLSVKQAEAFRKSLELQSNHSPSAETDNTQRPPQQPVTIPEAPKTTTPPSETSAQQSRILNPCLAVQVGDLTGQLHIHRAATEGHVWVRYDDGTEDMTSVNHVTLISITEQSHSTQ